MLIDRSQRPWAIGCAVAAAVAGLGYAFYHLTALNGPRGGSIPGLIFAFGGTGIIVFECLLSLRKKFPAAPLGRASTWLRAHIWLGLLSFLLILFHTGFAWGQGLALVLMGIFALITLSGVFGIIMQNYLPRRMTATVPRETVYEEIPSIIEQIRAEADERVEFITADLGLKEEPAEEVIMAGGRKYYFDKVRRKSAAKKGAAVHQQRKEEPQIPIGDSAARSLRSHYLHEIRPFLFPEASEFSLKLFATEKAVAAYFHYFHYLKTILPLAAHDVIDDVEAICEERRQLEVQRRLHHWLHGWLYVHVPLSCAFLVLTLVHAVVSLRY